MAELPRQSDASIPERVRQADRLSAPPQVEHHPSRLRRLKIGVIGWLLWAHIYISMFSLAVVLFFSLTGITLNHPDWFLAGAERSASYTASLNPRWVALLVFPADGDPAEAVDKLAVVEHLRREHGITGALASFTADDYECQVTFKGPGYQADAFIERDTGHYTLSTTSQGLVAILNDLHKGRDTGPVWSVLIDISAILLALVSLTGLGLIFFLKLRRRDGLIMALAGLLLVLLVFWLGVP